MYWCPEVCIYTQKSTRIWKVYLQNVHEKYRFYYISITRKWNLVQPDTRLSPPIQRQSSFSSAASHQCLWDIAAAWLAVIFFSKNNRLAETLSYFQLSYQITDRLLAAGNYLCQLLRSLTFCMSIKSLQIKFYIIA